MVFVTRLIQPGGKSYNPVFAENEWSDIIEACHANEVPDEWLADGTCYGTGPQTAQDWVAPTMAEDMYKAGEYMIYTDGITYRCLSDTNFSPEDYPEAWERVEA